MNRILQFLSLSLMIGGFEIHADGSDKPAEPPRPSEAIPKPKGKAVKQPPSAEEVEANLAKAKATYAERLAAIKKNSIALLDDQVKSLRRKKDAEGIARLEAERKNLDVDPLRIPASIDPDRRAKIAKKIQEARAELDKGYGRAIGDYTLIARDEEAQKVAGERIRFREEVSPGQTPPPVNMAQAVPAPRPIKPPPLPPQGDFKFSYTYPGGAVQKGAVRITGNGLRHVDMPLQIGMAAIDGNGNLNMAFFAHRKIINGEAVLTKQANNRWAGTLVKEDGVPLLFELFR